MYAITDSGYRAITAEMAAVDGESKVTEVPPALLARIKDDEGRVECGQRLRATDWTQMGDAPLNAAQRAAWAAYRQQLRDLPEMPGFPHCEWPSPPA